MKLQAMRRMPNPDGGPERGPGFGRGRGRGLGGPGPDVAPGAPGGPGSPPPAARRPNEFEF